MIDWGEVSSYFYTTMGTNQKKELAAFLAGWADKMSVAGFVACLFYGKVEIGLLCGTVFFIFAIILKYWSMK